MRVLLILIVSQLSSTIGQNALKCCGDGENKISNNKCVRDKSSGKSFNILLTCESKYVLEPHSYDEDEFNVTDDGSLKVRSYEGSIPPNE